MSTTTTARDEVITLITESMANLDEADLLAINAFVIDEVKDLRRRKARRTVAALRVGDDVRVIPGKLRSRDMDNLVYRVDKVNRTRIVVRDDNGRRVTIPASVVEKV